MSLCPTNFVCGESRKPVRVGRIKKFYPMEFANYRVEHWVLLDNLKNEVIKKTLGYMIDFKEHDNLVVIPKPHSIEISNNDLYIAVILFSGFQNEEYETLKGKNNHHIVSFHTIMKTMIGFENMPIKFIDYMALFFMSLARTEDENIKAFLHLKNPCADETTIHLRKAYILKDVVWNYDLFTLLYKKNKITVRSKKIKNNFAASIVVNGNIEADKNDKLKKISSDFIKEFNKKRELLVMKGTNTALDKRKPISVGFGVTLGNNRAKKAVELALSSLLYKNKIIKNTESIVLLISTHKLKLNLNELGIINDYIKKKSEFNANIVTHINEDKNLGEALAVAMVVS